MEDLYNVERLERPSHPEKCLHVTRLDGGSFIHCRLQRFRSDGLPLARRDRIVTTIQAIPSSDRHSTTDRSIHLRFVLQVGGVRGELERHHSLRVI